MKNYLIMLKKTQENPEDSLGLHSLIDSIIIEVNSINKTIIEQLNNLEKDIELKSVSNNNQIKDSIVEKLNTLNNSITEQLTSIKEDFDFKIGVNSNDIDTTKQLVKDTTDVLKILLDRIVLLENTIPIKQNIDIEISKLNEDLNSKNKEISDLNKNVKKLISDLDTLNKSLKNKELFKLDLLKSNVEKNKDLSIGTMYFNIDSQMIRCKTKDGWKSLKFIDNE